MEKFYNLWLLPWLITVMTTFFGGIFLSTKKDLLEIISSVELVKSYSFLILLRF